MKILHTSDWHLGKMLYGRSLLEDQSYFINRVFLPLMEQERFPRNAVFSEKF